MDNLPVLAEVLSPEQIYEPIEPPKWEAEATVVLVQEDYARWFRMVLAYLNRLGAENGEDYTASVVLAGISQEERTKGQNLWRIHWIARTEKGRMFLNGMALTFRALPAPEAEKSAINERLLEKADDEKLLEENHDDA